MPAIRRTVPGSSARRWLIAASAVVLLGGAAALVVRSGDDPSPPRPESTGATESVVSDASSDDFTRVEVPTTQHGAESPESSTPASSGSTPSAPAQEADSEVFGPGRVTVGVGPGRYVAHVPLDSPACTWQRLGDPQIRIQALLDEGAADAGAQVIVELAATDGEFFSEGCGPWSAYVAPDTPMAVIGEGTWIVDEQIVPGRYRSAPTDADGSTCQWERQFGLSGQFFDIVESATVDGPTTVEILPSDYSFWSRGCGTWTPDDG